MHCFTSCEPRPAECMTKNICCSQLLIFNFILSFYQKRFSIIFYLICSLLSSPKNIRTHVFTTGRCDLAVLIAVSIPDPKVLWPKIRVSRTVFDRPRHHSCSYSSWLCHLESSPDDSGEPTTVASSSRLISVFQLFLISEPLRDLKHLAISPRCFS